MTETLSDLAARLTAADQLDPVARYRELGDLAALIKSAAAAGQDAAVAEACDTATYEQVAAEFGVSASEVNRRITAHRKRIGAPPRRGRKPGQA
jgi:DNA-directed RNA polymerase specialized sigma24 family protein